MSKVFSPTDIVLVGFMGAGKSSVGQLLARKTGRDFIDLDQLIVETVGMEIPLIFREHGEEGFRALETDALASLSPPRGQVVATGGGIVEKNENWPLLRSLGVVTYLRVSFETIVQRIGAGEGRPLASGDDRAALADRYQRRIPLYEQADFIVDADNRSMDDVALDIIDHLGREGWNDRKA